MLQNVTTAELQGQMLLNRIPALLPSPPPQRARAPTLTLSPSMRLLSSLLRSVASNVSNNMSRGPLPVDTANRTCTPQQQRGQFLVTTSVSDTPTECAPCWVQTEPSNAR